MSPLASYTITHLPLRHKYPLEKLSLLEDMSLQLTDSYLTPYYTIEMLMKSSPFPYRGCPCPPTPRGGRCDWLLGFQVFGVFAAGFGIYGYRSRQNVL